MTANKKEVVIIKLDYTLKTPEERKALVEQILAETPDPSPSYLEILGDYLVIPVERAERKKREIMTDNRMATINKRETSLEGLTAQLENGEDGIYNLINESKTAILQPKVTITKADLEEIPFLRQLRDSIERWEAMLKTATGREAYIIKHALIEMRKDQYIIKNAYRKPIIPTKLTRSKPLLRLDEDYTLDENDYVKPSGFNLCDPNICSTILCNYSRLKQDSYDDFEGDLHFLMYDFDQIAGAALAPYPIYEKIVEAKIDGKSNIEIQEILIKEFGKKHSLEYISSLWRGKIPKIIASAAEDQLLSWHFLNVDYGKYKKCSRCGQIKLAHNKYFSKNKTSRDGWYSICKSCRSKKRKES